MEVRDDAIRRFTNGDLRVLSNVELFGEGFDVPNIEAAILLRPTQSLGLYLQQVGRALRPADGKDAAIILDHAGNCRNHGFPDEDREWSLDGGATGGRREGAAGPAIKICDRCFAAQNSGYTAPDGTTVCRYCGHTFKSEAREVDQIAGTLEELDPAIARTRRIQEQASARDLESLIAIGRQRHYKSPAAWARYVLAARQAKIAKRTHR